MSKNLLLIAVRRAALLLAGCLLAGSVLTGCAQETAPKVVEDVVAKPTPTPTPTPEPTPTAPAPAAPFTVTVDHIQIASTSNAGMFAAAEPAVNDGAALAAVNAAKARLEVFLNAMFVDQGTRLSEAGIAAIVDPATLVPEARSGLGAIARDDVVGTVTGAAAATAQVQIEGDVPGTVTLFYSASFDLLLADVGGPVQQQGSASFVDRGAGMTLVAIDATTTFGGDLAAVLA